MVTMDKQEEVIRLRAMDYSFDKIASIVGVSKPKIMSICTEFETEIADVRGNQVEATVNDLSYATEERSNLYRKLIGKLHTEITSRDISTISTERLFTMLERTERSLSAIEQRTLPNNDNPFADVSDIDLEKIINATSSARV